MDNPTRVTGTSDSTIPYLDFGYTDGDSAGRMYIAVPNPGLIFFTPQMAPALFEVQKAALAKATLDASSQRVVVRVGATMTDAEIVAAVKAKMV